jgi:hypothetical protein
MAKCIMQCVRDVEPGASENEFVLQLEVVFLGAGVPGGTLSGKGPDGSGRVPCPLTITQLAQYANNVEDAMLAEAARLGVTGLGRTDCLILNYVRGA